MLAAVLESERLLIRPFQLGDEQAMYALNSNPIVQKYTGDTLLKSVEQARDILQNIVLKESYRCDNRRKARRLQRGSAYQSAIDLILSKQ